MEEFGKFLFGQVPWLKPILAWAIAFLAVLAIAAVPAYLVFFPLLERISAEIRTYLRNLLAGHRDARERREARLQAETETLKHQSGLRSLNSTSRALLERMVAKTSGSVDHLRIAIESKSLAVRAASKTLPPAFDHLRSTESSRTQLPEVPDFPQLQQPVARLRVARAQFLISSLLLAGIVAVNTGMLGQIIRELGFVPASYAFLGLPLAYIFALVLTLMEAGLGYLRDVSTGQPEDSEKVQLWPWVAVLLALIVGAVEGSFYSRVAQGRDATLELPFIGYQLKQSTLFFLYGFALVMILFGLGSFWYRALDVLRRGTVLSELRQAHRTLTRDTDRYGRTATEVTRCLDQMKQSVNDANSILRSESGESGNIEVVFSEIRQELTAMRNEPPQWANVMERDLATSDILHLSYHAAFWFTGAVAALMIMTYVGSNNLAYLYYQLPALLCAALALGQGVVFLCAGGLARGSEIVVQSSNGNTKVIAPDSIWAKAAAIAIIALLTLVYIVVPWRFRFPQYRVVLWIFTLLLGYLLVMTGYHLITLPAVLRLWMLRNANAAITALEFGYRILVRMFCAAISALRYIALGLAAPVYAVLRKPLPALGDVSIVGAPSSSLPAKTSAASTS